MSSAPPTPSEGSPSIVSRKVGAGIQARLAKLQGATGTPVITREVPKRFPNGYDDPFKERLDGTLRRSLSGTWSVHTLEAEASAVSTDGSHTLVEPHSSTALPTVSENAELKRRRDFTKNWGEQQQAVADQLLSPEPARIQSSPQPIIEEPELEEEQEPEEEPIAKNEPSPAVAEPEQKDPDHGILTPPISEPESKPARKPEPKKRVARPPATPSTSRRQPPPSSPVPAPRTPPRPRPRASAPASSSTLAPPPVPRVHLTPSPARTAKPTSLAPPRPHTSMSARRIFAPEKRRMFSSKVPEKVLPPPVRPRAVSQVYEGPTISSLAKQKPSVDTRGPMSRTVSRMSFL